jgi:hypothetical protein
MVLEVERICNNISEVVRVNKVNGEIIYPEEIITKIEEVL